MKRIAALATVTFAGLATAATAQSSTDILNPAPTILVEDFSKITVDGLSNDTVAGTEVWTTDGDMIGEVEELFADNSILVGIGGFLGLAEYDIMLDDSVVAWFENDAPRTEFRVYVDATKEQLLEIENAHNG